jgi:hypothetical protein
VRTLEPELPVVARLLQLCADIHAAAVGDLHGDMAKAIKSMQIARVVELDSEGNPVWVGKDATVVQLGDVLDRGDAEIGEQRSGRAAACEARLQHHAGLIVVDASGVTHGSCPRTQSVSPSTTSEQLAPVRSRCMPMQSQHLLRTTLLAKSCTAAPPCNFMAVDYGIFLGSFSPMLL